MYYKINKTVDQFLTSNIAKDGYIDVDFNNPLDVDSKLQLEFWQSGRFDRDASLNYIKDKCIGILNIDANKKRQEVLSESPEKLSYYISKAALALQSLTNAGLLKQFESEATIRGVTTEQLRDLVLQKSKTVYDAIDVIEGELVKAKIEIQSATTQHRIDEVLVEFRRK